MTMLFDLPQWAVIALVVFCGLSFSIGIPLLQWIDYRKDVKKYGKEIANEIARRYI